MGTKAAAKKKTEVDVDVPVEAAELETAAEPGSWAAEQPELEQARERWQLVTLSKPRRVLHDDVPAEVVHFARNAEGHKVLVFDGVACPRGVVTYKGEKCYVEQVTA